MLLLNHHLRHRFFPNLSVIINCFLPRYYHFNSIHHLFIHHSIINQHGYCYYYRYFHKILFDHLGLNNFNCQLYRYLTPHNLTIYNNHHHIFLIIFKFRSCFNPINLDLIIFTYSNFDDLPHHRLL